MGKKKTTKKTQTSARKEAVTVVAPPEPQLLLKGMRVIGTPETYMIGQLVPVWPGTGQTLGDKRVEDVVPMISGAMVKYADGMEEHFVGSVSFIYEKGQKTTEAQTEDGRDI